MTSIISSIPTIRTTGSQASPLRALDDARERVVGVLARWSIPVLRVSVGLLFIAFALPKVIPGASPVEGLVTRTVETLSFGLVQGHLALGMVAALELFIGVTLVIGRLVPLGLLALLAASAGFFAPLVLFPGELFGNGITLEAQYIGKDIVLVAAALVIGAASLGARLTAKPKVGA